jgi:hypothetical protein
LRLGDGHLLVLGQLRDAAQRNVLVGDHAAPAWEAVTPMLTRLPVWFAQLIFPDLHRRF